MDYYTQLVTVALARIWKERVKRNKANCNLIHVYRDEEMAKLYSTVFQKPLANENDILTF